LDQLCCVSTGSTVSSPSGQTYDRALTQPVCPPSSFTISMSFIHSFDPYNPRISTWDEASPLSRRQMRSYSEFFIVRTVKAFWPLKLGYSSCWIDDHSDVA
jgi:hypothetical protein